ncbi:MAG: acyl-CoA/acyl-ACP dehydrogenase [Halioglobus sp.]|nr:acyl-CoA/acyl-ACP dehydrogenase [Halioglobus sp.]
MNFEFSEEQLFIRDQARNFLGQECTPAKVRRILDSPEPFDRDLWQKIVELGWTAMTIPESYGGLGLGYLELCVIAEELGRALAPVPFSSSAYLATEAIKSWGTEAQKQHYLPKLAAGELIGTLALAEGLGAPAVESQCLEGNLTAQKFPVPDGDIADFAVVAARNANGATSLYLAELADAGVKRETLNSMDPTRSQARLDFDDVPVKPLGDQGAGDAELSELLDRAAVLLAFEQIGGCQAAMDMGIAYTKARYAFGRPIASFQAIKHKFADMYVALELARANAYYGACALASDAPDLPLAAATARVSATDAFFLISKENIQAHGGMGFTWEFDCHLYYRRAQLLSGVIGTQPQWKEHIVARLLQAA